MLFVYVVISSIVLVNLLIAMFSDTYVKIKANSELEFLYQKYNRVFLYQSVVKATPPPFNAPLLIWDLVNVAFSNVSRSRRELFIRRSNTSSPQAIQQMQLQHRSDTRAKKMGDDTMYMERYLRHKEQSEAREPNKLLMGTRNIVEGLQESQSESVDMLKDIQLSVMGVKGTVERVAKGEKPAVEETAGIVTATAEVAPTAGGGMSVASRHLAWVDALGFEKLTDEMALAVRLAVESGEALLPPRADRGRGVGAAGRLRTQSGVEAGELSAGGRLHHALKVAFPEYTIIEANVAGGVAPRPDPRTPTWVVDPPMHYSVPSLPLSAVSIGLCVNALPALGVVYDPHRDELFVSITDEGAYCNGERIWADASCTVLNEATLLTDVSHDR